MSVTEGSADRTGKKPEDRPQSAQELEQELSSCLDRSPWTQKEARTCWDQVDLTEPDMKARLTPTASINRTDALA